MSSQVEMWQQEALSYRLVEAERALELERGLRASLERQRAAAVADASASLASLQTASAAAADAELAAFEGRSSFFFVFPVLF